MSIEFKNKPLEWNEKGVEPADNLKNNGFLPGYKPPAAYFNNFMNKTFKSVEELQSVVSDVDTEAKNKDGGNADTVDGKHAYEFTRYKSFNTLEQLSESEYEGFFYIEYENMTGISLKSGNTLDTRPDGTACLTYYLRLYSNIENNFFIQTDIYCDMTYLNGFDGATNWWNHLIRNEVSLEGHTHDNAETNKAGFMSYADKTKLDSIETGANKIIIDNALNGISSNPVQNSVITKALSEKADKDHIHNASEITGFPSSLPANGGNADTVGEKRRHIFRTIII